MAKELPICAAMAESMRGYNAASFKKDFLAALVVSLIALPLSMALSIAVGLPPQHGIYTAIVAGFLAALLGGSIHQVSGPTAAFVVIIAPIVAELGMRGIIWCQIIAGFLLLMMGIFKLGKYIGLIPNIVVVGFTTGIAITIARISLPTATLPEIGICVVAMAVIVGFRKIKSPIPSPILGVVIAAGLAYVLQQMGAEISTIGNKFNYLTPDGATRQGIPPYPPFLHFPTLNHDSVFSLPNLAELKVLAVPAFVIALLAALESLLSATIADKIAGTKHHPNAELNGIGVGNIFSGLCAGIPATGALARTATNIHAGAVSPLAAAMHSLLIMLYVVVFAKVIDYVPMAALSALLLVTAYNMSHIHEFYRLAKTESWAGKIVLLTTFGFTVAIDMVWGIGIGLAVYAVSRIIKK